MKCCFIRKNTPELRIKLKELGYYICPCALFKDAVWLYTSHFSKLLHNTPSIHGIGYVTEDLTGRKTIQGELDLFLYENEKSENPLIDCGEDEEMFLKIAKENLL